MTPSTRIVPISLSLSSKLAIDNLFIVYLIDQISKLTGQNFCMSPPSNTPQIFGPSSFSEKVRDIVISLRLLSCSKKSIISVKSDRNFLRNCIRQIWVSNSTVIYVVNHSTHNSFYIYRFYSLLDPITRQIYGFPMKFGFICVPKYFLTRLSEIEFT